MSEDISYRIEGSYYESCNCDAICPCRRQDGMAGGRSTYGVCEFLLSWQIVNGHASEIDLSGLAVAIAGRYNDDEEGEPWAVTIYVDDRARPDQFAALGRIFRGAAKGNIAFTSNFAEILAIKPAAIRLDHTAGKERIRVGEIASAEVVSTIDHDGTVSCGIPGHDHPGQESVSTLWCKDGPLEWIYEERCGFATDFAYWN